MLSSWRSSNCRPSAPFLYEVASHVKKLSFRRLLVSRSVLYLGAYWCEIVQRGCCVESLDELADLVVPLFAGVENKSLTVSEWLDSPYGPDQLKVRVLS